jgi:sulfatase maturation enzyme AslB (radical SAM superfamily)
MKGLQSKEEHLKLGRASVPSKLRLVTFGLSERNVRLRKLDFINKDTVVANFDNNRRISGKGLWNVDTFVPDELPAFIKTHGIDYVVIMSDAVDAISAQLDSLGVDKYYSSALIKELVQQEENVWRNRLENQDSILMEVMKNLKEPILRCSHMENFLLIAGYSLFHCCENNLLGFDAKVCDFSGGRFPIDQYNKSFRSIVLQNIAHNGPCKGCPGLRYGKPNIWSKRLTRIDINVSLKCQLRCRYCFLPDNVLSGDGNADYSVLPLLEDLISYGMVGEGTTVECVGGEPTLYKHFDETVAFCLGNALQVRVMTNAVKFSQSIVDVLKSGGSILVDTDSGTRETYKVVKGADCHDRVWDNIKRYKSAGDVILKYILTADNYNEHELTAFIEKCELAGIRDIIISAQADRQHLVHKNEELRQKYFEAAKFFYQTAISNKINVQNFYYFSAEEVAEIKS